MDWAMAVVSVLLWGIGFSLGTEHGKRKGYTQGIQDARKEFEEYLKGYHVIKKRVRE